MSSLSNNFTSYSETLIRLKNEELRNLNIKQLKGNINTEMQKSKSEMIGFLTGQVASSPDYEKRIYQLKSQTNTQKSNATTTYNNLGIINPNRTIEEAIKDPNSEEHKDYLEGLTFSATMKEIEKEFYKEITKHKQLMDELKKSLEGKEEILSETDNEAIKFYLSQQESETPEENQAFSEEFLESIRLERDQLIDEIKDLEERIEETNRTIAECEAQLEAYKKAAYQHEEAIRAEIEASQARAEQHRQNIAEAQQRQTEIAERAVSGMMEALGFQYNDPEHAEFQQALHDLHNRRASEYNDRQTQLRAEAMADFEQLTGHYYDETNPADQEHLDNIVKDKDQQLFESELYELKDSAHNNYIDANKIQAQELSQAAQIAQQEEPKQAHEQNCEKEENSCLVKEEKTKEEKTTELAEVEEERIDTTGKMEGNISNLKENCNNDLEIKNNKENNLDDLNNLLGLYDSPNQSPSNFRI